jgi:integrase
MRDKHGIWETPAILKYSDTNPDTVMKAKGTKYLLTDSFIAERVSEQASRHRVFYDAHPDAPRGFGVRVTKKGSVSFVLNYFSRGAERRKTVGPYGKKPALSIAIARRRAADLRNRVVAGEDPIADERETKAKALAADAARKARESHTLQALMNAYVSDMRAQGKASADEVEALFARAVAVPYPQVAALPLEEVTVDAVMPAFHKMTKAGMKRDPEKLASYLRTAFNNAKRARIDARGHAYSEFNVRFNPLDDLRVSRPPVTPDAARKAKQEELTLSETQLSAYWKHISAMNDADGALLRLHLLTGGQRREQLCRLTRHDYDLAAKTVTLWDAKGRRSVAREHKIPLLPEVVEAIATMAGTAGHYLCSVTGGEQPVTPAMLDEAMKRASEAMVDAKEIPRVITPGVIRRTVETLLGQHDVSLEVRGQLQSHGLGGVQARHYDRGDYLRQKRDALELLRRLCVPAPNNVTPISRKGKTAKAA